MATLLLAREELGPAGWSQAHQRAFNRVALLWFHLHQATAVRKGVVELTHVSKCGGTSMCQLAALNGCRCAAWEAGVPVLGARAERCCLYSGGHHAARVAAA